MVQAKFVPEYVSHQMQVDESQVDAHDFKEMANTLAASLIQWDGQEYIAAPKVSKLGQAASTFIPNAVCRILTFMCSTVVLWWQRQLQSLVRFLLVAPGTTCHRVCCHWWRLRDLMAASVAHPAIQTEQ